MDILYNKNSDTSIWQLHKDDIDQRFNQYTLVTLNMLVFMSNTYVPLELLP